jgi:hypothetical protein
VGFEFEKSAPKAIAICIVCRGQDGPKSSKGTLRPDFQNNTRPKIFSKIQSHHKIRKRVLKKSRYSQLKTILS